MFTLKITLRPFLAEYLQIKYSWPVRDVVRIPSDSDLYFVLLDLLSRRPPSAPPDRGNCTIVLPNRSYGKRPEQFNYLSCRAQLRLQSYVTVMYWAEFHRYVEMQVHVRGHQLHEAVYFWLDMYHIESLSHDAHVKNFQRWRQRQSANRLTYKKH